MEKVTPKYKFVEEEGSESITPIKRKIAKTMEITETFNYYDALAYCMKMEKAIEDKKAEIAGLEEMVKAYRDEIVLIDEALHVQEMDTEYNVELHKALKEEEELKNAEIDSAIEAVVE